MEQPTSRSFTLGRSMGGMAWMLNRLTTGFSVILRTGTFVVLFIAGVLVIGEFLPRYLNGSDAPVVTSDQGSQIGPQVSALNPPSEAPGNVPTVSELMGKIVANVEEAPMRQQLLMEAEMEARLEGVRAMLADRSRNFDAEMQARLTHMERRMQEVGRANSPKVVRGMLLEFGCLFEPAACPGAQSTPHEIIDFFDDSVMNAPSVRVLFSNEELRGAVGYDPETGTWDNGVRRFFQP